MYPQAFVSIYVENPLSADISILSNIVRTHACACIYVRMSVHAHIPDGTHEHIHATCTCMPQAHACHRHVHATGTCTPHAHSCDHLHAHVLPHAHSHTRIATCSLACTHVLPHARSLAHAPPFILAHTCTPIHTCAHMHPTCILAHTGTRHAYPLTNAHNMHTFIHVHINHHVQLLSNRWCMWSL